VLVILPGCGGDRYSYKILMWKCLGKCVFERLMRLGDKFVTDDRVTGCNFIQNFDVEVSWKMCV
jgi:hypothetical protein